jgi:hypothetical protein
MADVKISQLPSATLPVVGTEVLPIVQSSVTSKVAISNILSAPNPGNLTFTGTGNRITGDFSNATVANRVFFQTSTANTFTAAGLITSGTGTYSEFSVLNSSDPANASIGYLAANGSTDIRLVAASRGTGTSLPLTFFTSSSERARIDTSGKLGINVVPAAGTDAKLQVTGGTTNATTLATSYSAASLVVVPKSTSGFSLAISSGTGDAPQLQVSANGAAAGDLLLQPYGGNLMVGTTTSEGPSRISSVSTVSGTACVGYRNTAGAGSTLAIFINAANTAVIGSISNNANTGVLYNVTSDYRLKTVIGPVADAGQRIDALQPVEYTWNADGSRTRGFLAHQFQEVYAGSVTGTKDAVDAEGKPVYQAMQASTSEVIADLVAEIKSLRQRLAAAGI